MCVLRSPGPTIAEDKELLEATQNPILSELRRGKEQKKVAGSGASGSGSIRDLVKIEEQLDELRQMYEDLKKKRYTRLHLQHLK